MKRREYPKNKKSRNYVIKDLIRRSIISAVFFVVVVLIVGAEWKHSVNDFESSKKESIRVEEQQSDTQKGKNSNQPLQNKKSSAVITLKDTEPIEIKLGEPFIDPGYTAEDKDGTDLTSQVKADTSGLSRAGDQQVVYTVMGNNQVEAETVRQVKVLPNTEYASSGLPICMYHYVYDPAAPPENIDNNFISTTALAEEMKYLHENGYYFPSWQEVRDYIDGKLLLPEKSIVLTFDDGPNYMYLGIPILERYQIPATSFVIAGYWNSREMLYGYASNYLTFESHSYKMHQGGGSIGHGGIYTAMSREEVLADLQKSFEICGNQEAFAYPFGDYKEEGCAVLEEAGLLCAVTTENSKAYPGDNPYLLPRVRMLGTQTLDQFISEIQ